MCIIGAENISDLFGLNSQECVGSHFSRLLAPSYKELTQQLVWESLLNKKSMLLEGQNKSGNCFPMTFIVAEQDMGGQSILIASIFSIHVEYGVLTINKGGIVIAGNTRAEKMFERSGGELRDKHIKAIIPSLAVEGSIYKGAFFMDFD